MPAPWPLLGSTVVVAALALGGCTGPVPTLHPDPHANPDTTAGSNPDRPAASAIAPREWLGRFSLSIRPGRADETSRLHLGRFALISGTSGLELALESPTGQTIARAGQTGNDPAWLELADGQRWEADTLDEVVARSLGYPLPVGRLAQWFDQRFEQVLERSAAGAIVSAQDSGWQIRVSPPRWRFERPLPEGDVTVVLVLDP